MGTRFGFSCGGTGGRQGERVDGVVGEGEAEARLVGAVIVDLELESVVELALETLRRVGDVHAGEDGQGVEQVEVWFGLAGQGFLQFCELASLVVAFGFEGVEAAA